jgi:hypothetical protein
MSIAICPVPDGIIPAGIGEQFYAIIGRSTTDFTVDRLQNSLLFFCGAKCRPCPIVLQKSKVADLRIFRENTKREAIADSYNLNRVTEVACEFNVRR